MSRLRTPHALLVAGLAGLCLSLMSALVIAAPARAVEPVTTAELKARAIHYLATSQSAEQSVMVGTLTARSSFEGRLWAGFLTTWARINTSMAMNPTVPTGLPTKGHVFIVLGSGLTKSGAVSARFERRLRLAAKAAKAYPGATVLISGGASRHGRTEADVGSRWLRDAGVKASRLIRETRSFSTIGNATYSMAMLARNPAYTSYSLISDSSHLRRASVLFEAAKVLVQQRSGRPWGIKRLANLAHLDLITAGRVPLKSSSVAIAADNVAALFSVLTQYRRLVVKAPAKPALTGLRLTPPATVRYQVGQRWSSRGMVAQAIYDGGVYTNLVTATRLSGFHTRSVGTRRATVTYSYRGVVRTAGFDYRVVRAGSTTTVAASRLTATRARTRVLLTATVKSHVSGVNPTGTVRFYLDGVRLGDVRLGSAKPDVAAFRYPSIAGTGTHRLTARYAGDPRVAASTRTLTVTVRG